MFRGLFKKHEEDEDIFEVDPVVEQRRKEKFSTPLIYDEEFKEEPEVTVTPTPKTKEKKVIEDLPTVEDNLRNIAKIVEEEQDQLKIIEERTGEFKLDFGTNDVEKQNSLIDEIDDDMSLDELMSLYEKKFKD